MALSPARQRNAVSKGMALGLLMCGRDELPFDKIAVDLSFESAVRQWRHSNGFRQVGTDLRNGSDGGVGHGPRLTSASQSSTCTGDGRTLNICARGSWHDEEIDADKLAESIDGDVPASGWKELAEAFLMQFERG